MYQGIRNMLFYTIIPAVLAALMLPMVCEAAQEPVSVSIPVGIETSGRRIPDGIPYTVSIQNVTPGAPMPETASITIKGSGQITFGPIAYRVPADYQYRICQNSEPQSDLTYDQTVYKVNVRVVNTLRGSLAAEIWASKDGDGGQKADRIAFTNHYDRPSDGGSSGGDGNGPGSSDAPRDGLTQIEDTATPLAGILPAGLVPDILIPENMVPMSMFPNSRLPKTGDPTNLALYIILAACSGTALVLLVAYKRRMDAEEG